MVDVAELVMRGRAEGFDEANAKLRTTQTEAQKTEGAVEGMGRSMSRLDPHVQNMNRALMANQRASAAASQAGLQFGRQFTDIAVSLGSGQAVMIVLLQQLPQLADAMAVAKMQGVGLAAAMKGVLASFTPFLAILAPIAVAVSIAAGAFGLLHRELSKDYSKDITKGLNLTEEQLDRVKDKSVTFGDTLMATFDVAGKRIMSGPVGDALKWMGDAFGDAMDWIAQAALTGFSIVIGVAIGGYRTVVDNWKLLPRAFGEIMIDGANAAIRGIQALVNGGIDLLNGFIDQANRLPFVDIDRLGAQQLPEIKQQFAGATAAIGKSLRENVTAEIANARAALIDFANDVGDAALARAVKRVLEQAGDAEEGGKAGKTDLEKRIEDTLRYIQALKDQTATLGMSAIAAKEYEIQQKANAEGIGELREEVLRYGDALLDKMRAEAVGLPQMKDQIALLGREVSLVAASNRERAVELALLTKRQQMTRDGVLKGSPDWNSGMDAAGQIAGLQEDIAEATFKANDALLYQLDLLTLLDDRARDAAGGMADAFGSVGRALGDVLTLTTSYARREEEIYVRRQDMLKQAGTDYELIGRIVARSNEESSAAQVAYYGDVLSASKQFFGEQTGAYKALQAVEMAYRTVQFAMAAKSVAMGAWEAAQNIPKYIAQATAAATAGAAKMFAQLGPFGFAAVAAMGVVLAAFGLRSLGGGGGSAPTAQPSTNTGTGTVLGSPDEQSQSIGNSAELAERYWNRDLQLSNRMVESLKAIESGIGDLTASIGQQLGIGGSFDTSGLGLGATTSKSLFGLISKTRTAELADQGIMLDSGKLADLLASGVQGAAYQIVKNTKTSSGFFGIGGGTSTWNSESTRNLAGSIERDLTDLLGSLRNGILTAAGTLGIEGATAVLDSFEVNLGRISFEGMDSDEISATLSAVFSALGDDMARAVLPNVRRYQEAGEGLMETLVRVATSYTTVDNVMASLGMTFEKVGETSISARMRLVDLAGGLEAFTEQAAFFAENFLTEQQRLAPVQAAVTAELARLGIATDISREEFAKLVTGLDTSRSGGAALYTALMNLAPALDQVLTYSEELAEAERERAAALADQRRNLDIALMEATGNTAGALAASRADELAAMDASLRALQQQVWAAQDAAAANQALTEAQANAAQQAQEAAERLSGLTRRLLSVQGNDAALLALQRQDEMAEATNKAERALLRQIYAAEDAATANAALADAQQKAADDAQALADRLAGRAQSSYDQNLRLLQAMGDETGALALQRAREYEQAANSRERRALREIYAAEDAAARQAKAMEAVESARSALTTSYEREASALQETIDKFAGFSDNLRAFRDDLGQQVSGGSSYGAARAEFDRVARLALLGNEDGLSGLQGAGQTYIDAALANASTALEYRRAIGQVVGAVDAAIGTSDRNKTNAERQLEALDKSVSGLVQIDESVLSVRDAILALEAAMRGAPAPAGLSNALDLSGPAELADMQPPASAAQSGEAADEIRDLRAELAGLRSAMEKVVANTAAGAKSAARLDNTLTRVTRDGDAMLVEAA